MRALSAGQGADVEERRAGVRRALRCARRSAAAGRAHAALIAGSANIAAKLVSVAFQVAGRADEVYIEDGAKRNALAIELLQAMKRAVEEKRLPQWVDSVIDGVPLAELLAK